MRSRTRTRILSILLTLTMLLSLAPVTALAAETDAEDYPLQVLTFPMIEDGDEMPEPQGLGVSTWDLVANQSKARYGYEGVTSMSISYGLPILDPVTKEQVTIEPEANGFLQVLDGDGAVVCASGAMRYYPWSYVYDEDGDHVVDGNGEYVYAYKTGSVSLTDSGNLEAGTYGLQFYAGNDTYPVDGSLVVVGEDCILITGLYTENFYYGAEAFDLQLTAYGFEKESDLEGLSFRLVNGDGDTVASSTGGCKDIYTSTSSGARYWRCYMEMQVEEDVTIEKEDYYVQLLYTGEQTLVDGYGAATAYPYTPSISLAGLEVLDAQSGLVQISFDYPDAATTYTVTVRNSSSSGEVLYTYTGLLEDTLEAQLTLSGAPVSLTSLKSEFYVDVTKEGYSYSTDSEYYDNPYYDISSGYAYFYPSYVSTAAESLDFVIEYHSGLPSAWLGEGDVITLTNRGGTVLATCDEVTRTSSAGSSSGTLTGTFVFDDALTRDTYLICLNGVQLDTVYATGDLRLSSYYSMVDSEDAVIYSNLGVFYQRVDAVNAPASARLVFKDAETGDDLLVSESVNGVDGEYDGMTRFDLTVPVEDLDALADHTFQLYFRPSDGDDYRMFGSSTVLTYDDSKSEIDWSTLLYCNSNNTPMGSDVLPGYLRLYNYRNISVNDLEVLTDLVLTNSTDSTTYAVTGYELPGWGNGNYSDTTPDIELTLDKGVTAGSYTLSLDGVEIRSFTVYEPTPDEEKVPYLYTGTYSADQGYVLGEYLPADCAYTAHLFSGYTQLTEDAVTLTCETSGDYVYLYYPSDLFKGLEDGEYKLRVYQDGVVLGEVTLTVVSADQPVITLCDPYYNSNWTRLNKSGYCELSVVNAGTYVSLRTAESLTALESEEFYAITDGWHALSEGEGEKTVYVQLADSYGNTTEPVAFKLWRLGEDGMLDIFVSEDMQGIYSGNIATVGYGAECQYASAVMELVDVDGEESSAISLNYQGLGPVPELHTSLDYQLSSAHTYANYTDENQSYTINGASRLHVIFSADTKTESYYDYIYVYAGAAVDDNELVAQYSGTEAAGKTVEVEGDTVTIRLTSDGSTVYYGYDAAIVDPDAPVDPEVTADYKHIYTYNLDYYTNRYLKGVYPQDVEMVRFYLADPNGNAISEVVERFLIYGNPDAVILPQFRNAYSDVWSKSGSYTVYGYATPNTDVTVTSGESTLATATTNEYGYFSAELTGLEDGAVTFTVSDGSITDTSATLYVDTTAPVIDSINFAFDVNGTDAATIYWEYTEVNLDYFEVYKNGTRLGYVYPNSNCTYSVAAKENDGNKFTIRAYDHAGNMGELTVSTSDQVPPTAPETVTVSGVTTTTAALTWTEGTDNIGVLGYDVYVNGVKKNANMITDGLTYTVTGLEMGTAYSFTVRTRDKAGNESEDSPEATAATVSMTVTGTLPVSRAVNGADETVDIPLTVSAAYDTDALTPSMTEVSLRYRIDDSAEWADGMLTRSSAGQYTWTAPVDGDSLPQTYQVQVSVTDQYGATAYSETETVTLQEGRVTMIVKDTTTGGTISGAELSIYQDGELVATGVSDEKGVVKLELPDGSYSLIAQADGYQPRSVSSITVSDSRMEFTIYMSTEDVLKVETTVKEMTYDEIVAAGIDPAAAGNQQVYQCTVVLDFVEFTYIYAGDTVLQGELIPYDGGVIYPAARDIFLIVPTQTTWLKEMFDVQLLVTNSSVAETVENCVATLTLPTGLSLADMTEGVQSATADLGAILPEGSASHHWFVRGDAKGEYNLGGTITAARVYEDIEEEMNVSFATKSPISVLAGDAMKLTITAEKTATVGEPYNVRFELRNVSSKSLYNVSFDVLGGTFRQAYTINEVLASYDLEGPFKPDADNSDLKNGFVLSADEFKPTEVLSGVFTITFAEGIAPDAVEYMLKQVFLFTGAGSTTEIPTEVIWVDSISGHVHNYDEGEVTTAATCTEAGEMTYTCTGEGCGETLTVSIPALGHDMGEWKITTPAGCATTGTAERTCQREGCTEKETLTLGVLGHDFSEDWTVDTEPTCTEPGSKSHHCTRCKEKTDVAEIPATGHTSTESDCSKADVCGVCGATIREAGQHNWGEWEVTTAATCTAEGEQKHTCTSCGTSETAKIEKLDHTTELQNAKAATCTQEGYTGDKVCTMCGETIETGETIDKVAHTYESVVTAPTCTEKGYTTHTCSVCGDSYTDAETAAPGHTWGEWIVTKEATEDEDGSQYRTCSVCGETETETISRWPRQQLTWPWEADDEIMSHTYGVTGLQSEATNESVDGNVTYSSSDESVATVDDEGRLNVQGVGTTVITATAAAVSGQYAKTEISYKLIISKAALTITANNHTISYGEVPAISGCTFEGFQYDDTEAVLGGEAVYTCGYEQYGAAGEYEIGISGLTAANYEITFVPGKLTVNKATSYTLTLGDLEQSIAGLSPVTVSIDPQDSTAQFKVEYQVNGEWLETVPAEAGEYPVRATLISSDNIEVGSVQADDTLTIKTGAFVDMGDDRVSVEVDVSEDGTQAEVLISDEQLTEILNQVNGDASINLGGLEGVKDVVLPGGLLEGLADKSNGALSITAEDASIDLGGEVLDTIAKAVTSGVDTVTLHMRTVLDEDDMNEAQWAAQESLSSIKPIIVDISLVITHADGTTTKLSELNGDVTVSIPYEVPAGMEGKSAVACYISADGYITYIRAKYENGAITFTTDHFSLYAVGISADPVVVVNGGSGSGLYAERATVTIKADSKSGYSFQSWAVVSGDVTLENKSETTFVMPAENVEVTATYKKNSSGGGSSGGGGSTTEPVAPVEPVEPVNPFEDVPADSYYEAAVLWAVKQGITSGTSATTFSPDASCTRAQAVTFLWRAAGSPMVDDDISFTDVDPSAYYAEAVRWAASEGITGGTGANSFSPDAVCTRAQIATFLWRADSKNESDGEMKFTDVCSGDYFYEAVLWAVENGVTNGTSETTFNPDAVCTRAQIVTFLWRALAE